MPLHEDPSKAASDNRIRALLTAPNEERRREAAAALLAADWQRIADRIEADADAE